MKMQLNNIVLHGHQSGSSLRPSRLTKDSLLESEQHCITYHTVLARLREGCCLNDEQVMEEAWLRVCEESLSVAFQNTAPENTLAYDSFGGAQRCALRALGRVQNVVAPTQRQVHTQSTELSIKKEVALRDGEHCGRLGPAPSKRPRSALRGAEATSTPSVDVEIYQRELCDIACRLLCFRIAPCSTSSHKRQKVCTEALSERRVERSGTSLQGASADVTGSAHNLSEFDAPEDCGKYDAEGIQLVHVNESGEEPVGPPPSDLFELHWETPPGGSAYHQGRSRTITDHDFRNFYCA